MKKLASLFFGLAVALLIGCSNDATTENDSVSEKSRFPSPAAQMNGKFSLIRVSGSIAGITNEFEPGTIVWTFDVASSTVKVLNNNYEAVEDFFDTGVYPFTRVNNTMTPWLCRNTLEVNSVDLGCMSTNGDEVTYTQTVSDGYTLTFKKM